MVEDAIEVQKSINQIADIINLLEEEAKSKIPDNVKTFFTNYYDGKVEYIKIKVGMRLKDQKMEKYTGQVIAYLVDKYLKNDGVDIS